MAPDEVAETISDLLNQSPDAFGALLRILHSFSSLSISTPDPGELFLAREHKYLNLMTGDMGRAIFPHASRPAFSAFAGITTWDSARNWVAHQVRSHAADEDWAPAPNLGELARFFQDALYDKPMRISHPPHEGQGGCLVRYVENYQ